jgi:hypothetical protein
MNKRELGAALRRGVLAGTIAGSAAGWGSFAAHAAVTPEPAPQSEVVAPQLPPLPSAPALAPLPNVRAVQAPALVSLPRLTANAPITKTRTS